MRATQTKIVERLSRSRELVVLDEIQPESENRPVGILRTFTFKLLPTFAVVYAGLCRGNSYGFHVNHRRPLCPEWISISQDLTFWRINDRFPATLYISFTFTDMTSDRWKVSPTLKNRQIVMKWRFLLWDLSVSLKQMFPRVRLVNCRCTAGNYHRKLSGFPVVALLPVVSACCQARMSFFLHHVATNYILKKSPLLLSQLSWQASFLAACQKRSNQIWNRNMRLCLVFSSQF